MAQGPVVKCLDPLLQAVSSDNIEIKQDALEVFADILSRFGNIVSAYHESLQQSFIEELASKRPTVRKRAITCLAAISVNTSDKLFEALIDDVLAGISKSLSGGEDLRMYIQCASAISKTAGHRFGKYLDKFVPLMLKAADNISEDESEDEVREYIMQAFESFIIRCPDEVKHHIELMLILCKEYLEYDPNYSYDSSDDEDDENEGMEDVEEAGSDSDTMGDDEEEEDEEEDEDEDDDGDYSDDDDISWKVRTSAVRCIGAMIKTRPDMADILFQELCSREEYPLISRFKERTESVKLELFNVFNDLLDLTTTVTTSATGEPIITSHKEIKYVNETKSLIMKRIKKQLSIKSSRTRLGVFNVLKKLVMTLQGGLDEYVPTIVSAVISALSSKDDQNITLKLEVLVFLRLLLKYHDARILSKNVEKLATVVYERVHEKYYKIISEALRVCGELVKVIASQRGTGHYDKLVKDVFDNVFSRLTIQDIDQDVKESAIHTMGLIIANLSDSKSVDLSATLPVLLDRLNNEVTRLVACKTFSTIAAAGADISSVLSQTVDELAQFLRKFHRPLRQASLLTLREIVRSYSDRLTSEMYKNILTELEPLISDSDLFLAHLSLQLIAQMLESKSDIASIVKDIALPRMLELLESTTLQGTALESLLAVLRSLVNTVGFSTLHNAVLQHAKSSTSGKDIGQKQIFTNVGKCIAALCENASNEERQSTIDHFVKNLSSGQDHSKMLALFALGEIGRSVDLSSNTTVQQQIEHFFDSGSEEFKNAASYALGNISVGNMRVFVPRIISEIRTNEKRKYLMIHSLKEAITQSQVGSLRPFIGDTVSLLLENCEDELEGIRNIVCECLGKIAHVGYDQVIPQLKTMLTDPKHVKRASAILSASKYILSEQPSSPVDDRFKVDVFEFLGLLDKSQAVSVRRAAIVLLTSIAHSKPILIRDYLDRFLPHLYAECVYDSSLVRVVKFGPFSKNEDDGLELRKSAFECLDTIIDTLKDRIDPTKFVAQLPLGLGDKNADIVMLTNFILIKAVDVFPEEVVQQTDAMVKPMTTTLKKKLKESAVQQEQERHNELLQSTLRAVYAISKLKGMEDSIAFNDMLKKVIDQDPALKAMFKSIVESNESPFGSAVQ